MIVDDAKKQSYRYLIVDNYDAWGGDIKCCEVNPLYAV